MCTNLRLVLSRHFATKQKTVDPKEIKQFAELANEWWNVTGTLKPLHSLNECRVPWIQNRLTQTVVIKPDSNPSAPLTGISILDVGCGGGVLSESLSRLGCNVTGIDAGSDLIEVAKLHASTQNLPNLRYMAATIQDHAVENREKYDVVVSSEVIEHVTEKEEFVKYCVQCAKPGGSVLMTSPNKTWLSWFHMIYLMENVFKMLPKGTHRYDMFIHIDELKKILKEENCETLDTHGMFYHYRQNKWYLIKSEKVTYLIHAVKKP